MSLVAQSIQLKVGTTLDKELAVVVSRLQTSWAWWYLPVLHLTSFLRLVLHLGTNCLSLDLKKLYNYVELELDDTAAMGYHGFSWRPMYFHV